MATGIGTQTDPYIVSSWADFKTAIAASGAYVVLDPDASSKVIDLNGSDTNPVTDRLDFNCASLEGNGWRIRNLYFSSTADHLLNSDTGCNHEIKNLHFDNLVCNNGAKSLLCMPKSTMTACSFTGVKYIATGCYPIAYGTSSYSCTVKSCTFAMQQLGSGILYGLATRCDFTDCNFFLDAAIAVESGRRMNAFSYCTLADCLMRGSVAFSTTGSGASVYITDGNKPMKNSFIGVDFTNTSDYTISLYPGSATAATCVVSDLIGSGISYYNGTNVYWVTEEQGKSAAYLNSIGFPVTEV